MQYIIYIMQYIYLYIQNIILFYKPLDETNYTDWFNAELA